jgi:hypothetical protein
MIEQELLHLTIDDYLLGSSFCQKGLQRGGVCIFVKTNQHFSKIDSSHHCKEQDFEICAVQLVTKTFHLIILSCIEPLQGKLMNLYGDWMQLKNTCTIHSLSVLSVET